MTFTLVIDGHRSEHVYAAVREIFKAEEGNGQLSFHFEGRDILCSRFTPPEDHVLGSYLLIQTCTAILCLIDPNSQDMFDQHIRVLERCRIAIKADRPVKLGLFPGDDDSGSFRSNIEQSVNEMGADFVDIDRTRVEQVIIDLIEIADPAKKDDEGSCYLL